MVRYRNEAGTLQTTDRQVLHHHVNYMVATAPVTLDATSLSINSKSELRKLKERLEMFTLTHGWSPHSVPLRYSSTNRHFFPLRSLHTRTQNPDSYIIFFDPLE